jgi:predicted transcriptional regulator
MKHYLISLKEEFFDRIIDGTKPYEFRRVFASSLDEPFIGVIYVSSPIQAIKGVVYFDKPIRRTSQELLELARESGYPFIEGVREYFKGKDTGYALPVKWSKLFKQAISLRDIKKIYPGFRPPQSFYCLENQQFLKLKEYLNKYESHDEIN